MIDWNLVVRIAGGGFGVTILVLLILALVAWILGMIVQRATKVPPESKQNSSKG